MKRSPLPAQSKKRKDRVSERKAVIAYVHERDQWCKFWQQAYGVFGHDRVPAACGGPLDVHEIIPRSVWPEGMYDPTNCVLLCRLHHAWVGDNPNDAALIGLHDNSWNRRKDGTPDA